MGESQQKGLTGKLLERRLWTASVLQNRPENKTHSGNSIASDLHGGCAPPELHFLNSSGFQSALVGVCLPHSLLGTNVTNRKLMILSQCCYPITQHGNKAHYTRNKIQKRHKFLLCFYNYKAENIGNQKWNKFQCQRHSRTIPCFRWQHCIRICYCNIMSKIWNGKINQTNNSNNI